jgi:hypothetical protein
MSVVQQFSNTVQHMSSSAHGHPSSYQGVTKSLVVENDVLKRIQASVVKNGIRIQEFFIDFDKLRKGTCSESAVSYKFRLIHFTIVPYLSWHPLDSIARDRNLDSSLKIPTQRWKRAR